MLNFVEWAWFWFTRDHFKAHIKPMHASLSCWTKLYVLYILQVNKLSKNVGAIPSSSCLKGRMKQIPYWGLQILEWPVNLTVNCNFLLDACELIHILMCVEKTALRGCERERVVMALTIHSYTHSIINTCSTLSATSCC